MWMEPLPSLASEGASCFLFHFVPVFPLVFVPWLLLLSGPRCRGSVGSEGLRLLS